MVQKIAEELDVVGGEDEDVQFGELCVRRDVWDQRLEAGKSIPEIFDSTPLTCCVLCSFNHFSGWNQFSICNTVTRTHRQSEARPASPSLRLNSIQGPEKEGKKSNLWSQSSCCSFCSWDAGDQISVPIACVTEIQKNWTVAHEAHEDRRPEFQHQHIMFHRLGPHVLFCGDGEPPQTPVLYTFEKQYITQAGELM